MSIFSFYPKVSYKVNDYDYFKAIDLTTSIRIKDYFKNYRGILYTPYVVKDGERPDNVAYKFYGDPNLDWVVLLSNEMYNVYEDWPLSSIQFENYIIDKYGSISYAMSTTKYHYDRDRNIVDETAFNALSPSEQGPIETVYQWENRKNINKSKIKLVKQDFVGSLQSDLKSLLFKPVV